MRKITKRTQDQLTPLIKTYYCLIFRTPLTSRTSMRNPGRTLLICFLFSFLAATAALVYPVYVIRPFRHQGPRELMVALTVLRYRPALMLACVLFSLTAFAWYWTREKRTFRRVAAAASVIAVAAIAILSRVNIYEIMFKPFDRPSFAAPDQSKLDPEEKVIAVNIRGQARAYPIRIISYHHVINDRVGGLPIVATY